MGDTACLMHAFSYTSTSGLSIEQPNQGNGNLNPNSMNALGESVSFGRFTSESLSWEKWSTFSHNNNNRYVEEAERFSQPGSVAQKKAFFEAHYKRIAAAKKAAALLEQENAANSNAPDEIPGSDGAASSDSQSMVKMEQNKLQEHEQDSGLQKEEDMTTPLEIQSEKMAPRLAVNNRTLKLVKPQLSVCVPTKSVTPNSTKKSFDIQDDTSASENSGTPQIEKPLLKSSTLNRDTPSVNSKKKSAFSSFKSSIYPKTSKVPSPTKMVPPRTKNENKTTPIVAKKSTLQIMEKKETKKPLSTYNDYTPARTPERLFEPSNTKTPNSRVRSAAYKAFQACMSPLRTPNMAASTRMSMNASAATPQPENTRINNNPPRDGSKTTTPKWKILSAVCAKSPTVSTPFNLRTEERAARRKQKLEEKFNSKETPKVQLQTNIKTPKVQLQTKIKEKAENELRKLRRSFCFNAARLPPSNYSKQKRETAENHTKMGATSQAQSSSKMGRKLSSSGPSISQQPSYGPSNVNKSYNNKPINRRRNYLSSLAGITSHENTSPNIRL